MAQLIGICRHLVVHWQGRTLEGEIAITLAWPKQNGNHAFGSSHSVTFSAACSNKLKNLNATTTVGSHHHIWPPSPANARHELLVIIICLLSGYRVNRTKLMRSYWHGKGFVVRIYLQTNKHMSSSTERFTNRHFNSPAREVAKWISDFQEFTN